MRALACTGEGRIAYNGAWECKQAKSILWHSCEHNSLSKQRP